jgi:hypothetical protein
VVDPRTPVARLGALAAAALFLAGGVDRASAASHCPHHGALPAPSAGAHAHGAALPQPADRAPAHGPCTCVGACALGALPALALRASAALPAPPMPGPAASAPAPATIPPARRDHQLPFATAPPTDR